MQAFAKCHYCNEQEEKKERRRSAGAEAGMGKAKRYN